MTLVAGLQVCVVWEQCLPLTVWHPASTQAFSRHPASCHGHPVLHTLAPHARLSVLLDSCTSCAPLPMPPPLVYGWYTPAKCRHPAGCHGHSIAQQHASHSEIHVSCPLHRPAKCRHLAGCHGHSVLHPHPRLFHQRGLLGSSCNTLLQPAGRRGGKAGENCVGGVGIEEADDKHLCGTGEASGGHWCGDQEGK